MFIKEYLNMYKNIERICLISITWLANLTIWTINFKTETLKMYNIILKQNDFHNPKYYLETESSLLEVS